MIFYLKCISFLCIKIGITISNLFPMQTITLSLTEKVYRRLEYAATSARKSIHELAMQSVQESLPPLLDAIPARYEPDLRALERLDDDDLWMVAYSQVDENLQKQLRRLLRKNSQGELTASERKTLAELRSSTNLVMLRKAYAFLLLRWRGHRIPSLAELENGT